MSDESSARVIAPASLLRTYPWSLIPHPHTLHSSLSTHYFSLFTDFSLSGSRVVSSEFYFPAWESWQRVLPQAALHSASCGNKLRKRAGQPAPRAYRRNPSFLLKPPMQFRVCKPGRRRQTMRGPCFSPRLSPARRPEPCQFCRLYRSLPSECWLQFLHCSPRPTFLRLPYDRCLQGWKVPLD